MRFPLSVAFVWHMHQPYYRVPGHDEAVLPWVRLHAAKDYSHMLDVLAGYPRVHATFNLAPSLNEQLIDYGAGRLYDRVMTLAQRPTWTADERAYLLDLCFSINWNNIARRYPRYNELIERRGAAGSFNDQELRDLLTWFNLGWTDPNVLETDPALRALVHKGRDFDLADTRTVLQKHVALCADVMGRYRALEAAGQIEITTSPYYHPILPLLIDNRLAARATPGIPLPPPAYNFSAAEDAERQIRLAVAQHTRLFGRAPRGMWPSEGAVAPEILPPVQAAGLQWLASDEEILARSLGVPIARDHEKLLINPALFYQPYRLLIDGQPGPAIIFRDHEISDRIGFLYQSIHGVQAADELVTRLQWLHWRLGNEQPYLVPIILDGENCWEWYEHNGDVFLHHLYARLDQHAELRAVTVSEYLDAHPPQATLPHLATGSWIRGDLTTWIGDPEHTRAWSALARTRADLEQWQRTARPADPQRLARAWQAIDISEGSDWFWWYSRNNSSDQDRLFDETFRAHLAVVYDCMGQPLPDWVSRPIVTAGAVLAALGQPTARISPSLHAPVDASPEWNGAAVIRSLSATGTMQRADTIPSPLHIVRVGCDQTRLYVRFETAGNAATLHLGCSLRIEHERTVPQRWVVRRFAGTPAAQLYRLLEAGDWQLIGDITTAVKGRVCEIAVPLEQLALSPASTLAVQAEVMTSGGQVHQLPAEGPHLMRCSNL